MKKGTRLGILLQYEIRGWPIWQILLLFLIILAIGIMAADMLLTARQTATIPDTPTARPPTSTIIPNTPRPSSTPTFTPSITPSPTPSPTPTSTPTPTRTPTATSTPTPTPIAVITGINAFGRLETTQYTMRDIIELEDEPTTLFEQFSRDKLLLIAEGEVVAGFDLTKVTEGDILVRGTKVVMLLPPPEILYSRIDNEKTFVYERATGLFRYPDQGLETEARRLAEAQLVSWALERDILAKAEENGLFYLENFLRSLGFTEIVLEVQDAE
ncbi:MAG: DUF4230 domain-containing protein [Anaerolineae bacterium]|nr:DUF4230 domain-containing protein [Anaerolineae bacterium]